MPIQWRFTTAFSNSTFNYSSVFRQPRKYPGVTHNYRDNRGEIHDITRYVNGHLLMYWQRKSQCLNKMLTPTKYVYDLGGNSLLVLKFGTALYEICKSFNNSKLMKMSPAIAVFVYKLTFRSNTCIIIRQNNGDKIALHVTISSTNLSVSHWWCVILWKPVHAYKNHILSRRKIAYVSTQLMLFCSFKIQQIAVLPYLTLSYLTKINLYSERLWYKKS